MRRLTMGAHGSSGRPPGFTLIEILVVVAIISILSAIAVPNFLNAQTRSKVARVANDQRTLATGLESYFVDNARYPLRNPFGTPGGTLAVADVKRRAEDMAYLTTPVSYLTTLPIDIFEKRIAAPNNLLEYISPLLVQHYRASSPGRPKALFITSDQSPFGTGTWNYAEEVRLFSTYDYGWAVASVGPDATFGWPNSNLGNYGYRSTSTHWFHEYDPTNGTVSDGNIYRFQKQGAKAHNAFPPRPQS
ncbi:prepilin-type N-terminal cleavage/methylation domain-containing protein [bacterium]|nr:prepilin-type N-terminal cleavage/methylation domain-containing protein [bacterium]